MSYDPTQWVQQLDVKRTWWGRWAVLFAIIMNFGFAIAIIIRVADRADVLPNMAPMLAPFFGSITIAVAATPFARNMGLPSKLSRYSEYDEFEKMALMHATQRAYQALVIMGAALAFYCGSASMFQTAVPREVEDWFAIALAFTCVGGLLPACFAEFMIPMPSKAESEEEV